MFLKEKIIFSNSYFPKKSPIEAQVQVCPKKSKILSPIVSNLPHLKKIQVSYAKFATLKENKVQIRLKNLQKIKSEVESENFRIQSRNPSWKRKFEPNAEIEVEVTYEK